MARFEPYMDVLAGVFRKALFHRFARANLRALARTVIDQAFSTIMRPRISMCSAWQNQLQ